jgi:hypothetical protein
MVPYQQLKGADPLAKALTLAGFTTVSWIVSLGAVVSLTAVLLVFQYGQPRIFFAMGRDGLLPRWASKVHPKTRVPHITTLVTGIAVAVGALLADENEIYDLTEHRHALRVCNCLHRSSRAALHRSDPSASVQGSVRVAGNDPWRSLRASTRCSGCRELRGSDLVSGW